jgi:cyclopropane-fatty-acyl-phospholipid synthase
MNKDGNMLNDVVASKETKSYALDTLCRRFVLHTLSQFPSGSVQLFEPDGSVVSLGEGMPAAHIEIVDWRAYRMLFTGGGLGAGEAYMEGLWRSDDLVSVVRFFAVNVVPMQRLDKGLARLAKPLRAMLHQWNRNSLSGSKRNISAHYDLGNEFFKLFLDPTMMYSSAVFPSKESSLYEASVFKLDMICRKLELNDSHHLLEVGTGWGGMAIYAAKHYGCKVTTTTISQEQYLYTCEKIREEGLEGLVTVLDQDYRLLTGKYDRIVSIEMIEAVGHQFLPTYFSSLQDMLKPEGIVLLQAITIPDQRYQYALKNMDFIKRYIFPGGFLPSITELCRHVSAHTEWVVKDIEDIGHDYAQTISHWRDDFMASLDHVERQGFDQRFTRMWDYYLAYCEGAFLERAISTVHLLATAPNWRPAIEPR